MVVDGLSGDRLRRPVRTARSRISSGYLPTRFAPDMTPSSRKMEQSPIPGRFIQTGDDFSPETFASMLRESIEFVQCCAYVGPAAAKRLKGLVDVTLSAGGSAAVSMSSLISLWGREGLWRWTVGGFRSVLRTAARREIRVNQRVFATAWTGRSRDTHPCPL